MKKVIAILVVIALCSFKTNSEKKFSLEFGEAAINNLWRQLDDVQVYLDQQNLPHQDLLRQEAKLDSVRAAIWVQVRPQLVAYAKADSIANAQKAAKVADSVKKKSK